MGNTHKSPVVPPHADSMHNLNSVSDFCCGDKEFKNIDIVLCVAVALSSVSLSLI